MKFIETHERVYSRGGYISNPVMFAVDDIRRIVQCEDDYNFTNIITKDGKVHTTPEKYEDLVKKIKECCEPEGKEE